jgi:hypothetical protein
MSVPDAVLKGMRDVTARVSSRSPISKLQIPPLRFATVGMTKFRTLCQLIIASGIERTAGRSTTLRSGSHTLYRPHQSQASAAVPFLQRVFGSLFGYL